MNHVLKSNDNDQGNLPLETLKAQGFTLVPTCEHIAQSFFEKTNMFSCPLCHKQLERPEAPYIPPQSLDACGIWKFKENFPDVEDTFSLGEGGTPLLRLSSTLIIANKNAQLKAKIEATNPTGSYKDRGTALAIATGKAFGYTHAVLASTGNAAASASAYARRAGMALTIVVPDWIDEGKLFQIEMHKPIIKKISGTFFDCEKEATRIAIEDQAYPCGSENPYRTPGNESLAFELFEAQKNTKIDRIICPIGTGSLIHSLYRGFKRINLRYPSFNIPRIDGVHLEHILAPHKQSTTVPAQPLLNNTSVATGINIPKTLLAREAAEAVQKSHGQFISVNDDEILEARRLLAHEEGIAAEPTGCASVAAYRKAVHKKKIKANEHVIVIITGHALKQRDI